ncbi:tyrosine-type recombinase/integrase [Actinomycetaceae bacterium L2_0104]
MNKTNRTCPIWKLPFLDEAYLMLSENIGSIWSQEIDAWRVALNAMRLSPETIDLRTYHLRRLARADLSTTPWVLERSSLLDWTGQHQWRRETARAVRSSFRRFWEWGVQTGRTTENIADILPEVKPEQPRPRPAAPQTVTAALSNADKRVALMMRLANELGMRRAEVAQVHPENDLVKDTDGWILLVHGKGSRKRLLPIPETLALEVLSQAPTGYLFPSPSGGHLTPHWVGTLVSRALADGTTMHQLRHLCATEVHDQTHDVRLVQSLLGHASLATTQRYLAVDDSKVREALATRSQRWVTA